jgi:hypothetical protein
LSYARRYALSAILCLAAEDDDGEAASRQRKPSPAPAQALRKMVAVDPTPAKTVTGPYPEETTRKRLGQMFGDKFVSHVLEWAMSPDRKKPTPVTGFTETHFSSLEKNRAAIEKHIEDATFAQKNGPNAIPDDDAWGGGIL